MGNQWFRMYSEFATDPKVQSMSEAMQRRLVMLFCLRSSDVLVTLCDDEIAFALRVTEHELAETKALFERKKFINSKWEILNWDKRQFASDTSTERTRRYRERLKTSRERHSDLLDTDTDTDTDKTINQPSVDRPPAEDTKRDVCPYDAIVGAYHASLPMLPRVQLWTPRRKSMLRARWYESKERQRVEWWADYFAEVAKSEFLTGKAREWRADFEWLIAPRNFTKVLEGKYRNGKKHDPDPQWVRDLREQGLIGDSA